MDLDELLALLDIETPSDLAYFEQFADMMEEPRDITFEALNALVEGMEPDSLSELLEGYFEEILKSVPDGEDDLYTLLLNISVTLQSLSTGNEEDGMSIFAEELYKFRSWYLFENSVICEDRSDGSEREIPLSEALTNNRVQNFTDDDYLFDFSGALDYQLDEYIVSLGDIIEDSYGDGDEEEEDDDYRDPDDDE